MICILLLSLFAISGATNQEIWFTKSLDYFALKRCNSLEKTRIIGSFQTCTNNQTPKGPSDQKRTGNERWPQSLGGDLEKVIDCFHIITNAKCLLKSEAVFFYTTKHMLVNQRDYIKENGNSVNTDKETVRTCARKPHIDVATQCFSKIMNKYDWLSWPLNYEDNQMCKFLNELRSCEVEEYSSCSYSLRNFINKYWSEGFRATPCRVSSQSSSHSYYSSSYDHGNWYNHGSRSGHKQSSNTGAKTDNQKEANQNFDANMKGGKKETSSEEKSKEKDDKKDDSSFDWSGYPDSGSAYNKPPEGVGSNTKTSHSHLSYNRNNPFKSWYENRRRNEEELERDLRREEREREEEEREEEKIREDEERRRMQNKKGTRVVVDTSEEWMSSEEKEQREEQRREKEEERMEREREEAEERRERQREKEETERERKEEEREREMEKREMLREKAEEERQRRLEEENEKKEREQEERERREEMRRDKELRRIQDKERQQRLEQERQKKEEQREERERRGESRREIESRRREGGERLRGRREEQRSRNREENERHRAEHDEEEHRQFRSWRWFRDSRREGFRQQQEQNEEHNKKRDERNDRPNENPEENDQQDSDTCERIIFGECLHSFSSRTFEGTLRQNYNQDSYLFTNHICKASLNLQSCLNDNLKYCSSNQKLRYIWLVERSKRIQEATCNASKGSHITPSAEKFLSCIEQQTLSKHQLSV